MMRALLCIKLWMCSISWQPLTNLGSHRTEVSVQFNPSKVPRRLLQFSSESILVRDLAKRLYRSPTPNFGLSGAIGRASPQPVLNDTAR